MEYQKKQGFDHFIMLAKSMYSNTFIAGDIVIFFFNISYIYLYALYVQCLQIKFISSYRAPIYLLLYYIMALNDKCFNNYVFSIIIIVFPSLKHLAPFSNSQFAYPFLFFISYISIVPSFFKICFFNKSLRLSPLYFLLVNYTSNNSLQFGILDIYSLSS